MEGISGMLAPAGLVPVEPKIEIFHQGWCLSLPPAPAADAAGAGGV